MKLKRYLFLPLLLLFSLPLFGVEHITLQLRWLHQFQFAGYYMAEHKGFYRDAGLRVTIKEASGKHRHPVNEVLSNRAQYGIGNAGLVIDRINSKPIVVLATLFQTSPNVWILRKDSNISTIIDLATKRLMMTDNVENAELIALFSNEGVSIDQLNLIESSFDINDLIDKKVDAFNGYSSNEPYYLQEKGIEYITIGPRKYGIDFYSDALFTSQEEVLNHPKRVKSFLEASLKGWEYALLHPEETIDIILKHYSKIKTREHLQFEAKAIRELMQPQLIEVGHTNPKRWQYIANTYYQLGFIASAEVPDDFLYVQNGTKKYVWLFWALGIASLLLLLIGSITLYIYRLNRKIKEQAIRDPLTGLLNRRYLHETLPHEIARADRERYPISVIMLDLDYFKLVNDNYGHGAGDEVLKSVAATLSHAIRQNDFICRYGGEEFLIVMPEMHSQQALERMEACRQEIQNTPISYKQESISITISGGIAVYDVHGKTQDALIQAADDALYRSKTNGRNQITLAQTEEKADQEQRYFYTI